jgi:hypothetical protein
LRVVRSRIVSSWEGRRLLFVQTPRQSMCLHLPHRAALAPSFPGVAERFLGGAFCLRGWIMSKTVFIYALVDPRTQEVRYVGKTACTEERLRGHLYETQTKHTYKGKWLAQLRREGLKPELVILEEVPEEVWQDAERRQITLYRAAGARLTNGTDGGEGPLGRVCSPETRGRMSVAQVGKTHTPEARAKIGESARNRSPEARAKMSEAARIAATKRKPISPETRKRMAAASRGNKYALGNKLSAESRARMSAAQIGKIVSPETRARLRAAWNTRKGRNPGDGQNSLF